MLMRVDDLPGLDEVSSLAWTAFCRSRTEEDSFVFYAAALKHFAVMLTHV